MTATEVYARADAMLLLSRTHIALMNMAIQGGIGACSEYQQAKQAAAMAQYRATAMALEAKQEAMMPTEQARRRYEQVRRAER